MHEFPPRVFVETNGAIEHFDLLQVDWNIGYQSFKLASALCRRELRRVENDESPLSRCNHVYSAVG